MAEEKVTHQLAAIVYADVSGYSRLTEADEIGTHRQLSASLDLIADRIRNAAGEVVHYAGDAVLARFQSVVAATNCAFGIQNAIGALCAELAEDKRLLFRIGINLGEVIVDRNSSLVKLSGLFLVTSAVEHYRDSDVSAIQAGNELGVRHVLEGAVQMSGDRIRITIQLTDAPAAQIIWAERYDRVIDNIFDIQDEITTKVAVALELVLRGISHLYMGSENGNAIARGNFEKLIEICPDSSQALALMAFTNWVDVMRGWSSEPDRSIERAATQAEQAIELGDPDSFGRIVLGSVRLFQGRHGEALALSEEAVSVRASCPLARAIYSNVLNFNGQHDRAIKNIKTAVRHARIYPPWMANVLSASYRDSGQISPSITVANECLRLDPENVDAHVLLCTNYSMSNSADDARRFAQEILSIDPAFSISTYIETQPYRDSKTLQGIVGALREAGLPE